MTTLMRYSPYSSLRREIDRIFDAVADEQTDGNAVWAPRTDLSETEDGYVIRMDVPGLAKDALTIEQHDGTLTVSGERAAEHEDRNETMHRVERVHGRFFRSFTLPKAGDHANVSAHLADGVLTITVPKREETKPRRIEVN